MRRFRLFALILAFSATPLPAQTAFLPPLSEPLLRSAVPGAAADAAAGTPGHPLDAPTQPGADQDSAAQFGFSQAINVVLVSPGAVVDAALLRSAGGGWGRGHRWVRRADEDGRRVLGEPLPTAPTSDLVHSVADQASADGAVDDVVDDLPAPERPGVWRLESSTGSTLTVITQVPASQNRGGRLNGYHIGLYPTSGSGRRDAYTPPTHFIEVTPGNQDLEISRHLRLSQFLTKDQFEVWPKYVALDMRLIDKLELVMQELNAMGVHASHMHVMSGFRTPQYNGPGGDGRAAFSRHMWGDAADVWIDSTGDGQMDDLNGDSTIDTADADVILRAVERVEQKYPELVGGAGVYPANAAHGPFIHIDTRGHYSRW